MNRLILLILTTALLCLPIKAIDSIRKETYTYAEKEGVELKLDKYVINDTIKNKPCVIFLFGGGFVGGERDRASYQPYFRSLAENGNVVVSIDYRLGMKSLNLKELAEGSTPELVAKKMVSLFVHTIDMATEDLFDATKFILDKSSEWNVDKEKIIVSGSSAGAITALHGEYAICNKQEIAAGLPEDFKYAGVISFAGAIFSSQGDLIWKNKPAPCLLFHGNADKNVPYDDATIGNVGFYGSKYIVKQLDEMKVPYYFYDEEYGTHRLANTPMRDKLDIINQFIEEEIKGQRGKRVHSVVKFNDRKQIETNFSLFDYLLNNYQPK